MPSTLPGRVTWCRRPPVAGRSPKSDGSAGAARDPGGEPAPRQRDLERQVAGKQPGVADARPSRVAGHPVEVDAQAGRRFRREALGEQRPDRPGQDVARASRGEPGVLERGDAARPVGRRR